MLLFVLFHIAFTRIKIWLLFIPSYFIKTALLLVFIKNRFLRFMSHYYRTVAQHDDMLILLYSNVLLL